jgi:hypothetical protein
LDGHQHDQRAQWPIRAHSSVGRKRNENDRLGRSYRRRRRFEHRRKILRRWTEPNTHANTFSDSNRDSNRNGDGPAEASIYAAAAPDSGTSTLEVQK